MRAPPFRTASVLGIALTVLGAVEGCGREGPPAAPPAPTGSASAPSRVDEREARRVILFVWDGLRPDSISAETTPNLDRMARAGVFFTDHHATYPSFTMINAASLATGAFPADHGFYGNVVYEPGAQGVNARGKPIDFSQPVFTEDHGVLQALDAHARQEGARLLTTPTLFQVAQRAGLVTVAVGKTGPAFLQDYARGGRILDEYAVFPRPFVAELQAAGVPLPRFTPFAYPPGEVTLAPDNSDPTQALPRVTLEDGATSDPTDTSGSPYVPMNAYLMSVFLKEILPKVKPDLSVVWLRNPDSTEHVYGVGTANHRDALRAQDALLGELQTTLTALGLAASTDILVVSDHAHSTVSGPPSLFPLRAVADRKVGAVDPNGFSVSGDVRLADLLTRAGFKAFDGMGCIHDPVLSGIRADGTRVSPTRFDDAAGSRCGKPKQPYTTGRFEVPGVLPPKALVVAPNGGSDYVYVPDHHAETVKAVVRFLQSREEIGATSWPSDTDRSPARCRST